MFHRAQFIFPIFVVIIHCACGDNETIKMPKKRHADSSSYQMCLESFDVHKDKIIKTQDSRNMGATYLSVMDVDSQLDCLKYCCETERCDVFIFEEKKPGSCYLFECGPLHDFKCKFMRHANYTSAVRTSYPAQNIQTEEEIRISQQEHELKSLRKNNDITSDYGFTEASIKSIVTQIPKIIPTSPVPIKPACTKNQYECRSSGDCIAIYNVCDGIPQCADGSDEAADLTCPTEKPAVVPPMIQAPRPPADTMRYQQIIDQHKLPPLVPFYSAGPEINPKTWEMPGNTAHQMSQPQNILYPGQPMEIQMQMRKNYGSPGYRWDYQPLYEQNKESYVPANTFHDQNMNPYEQQSHIFNHKGLSVLGNNEGDRGLYMDSKYPYTSHFPSSNKGGWQENPMLLSPSASPVSDSEHKQINNVENTAKTTTTPACETSEEHKTELTQSKELDKKEEKVEAHLAHAKHTSKQVTKKPNLSASNDYVTKHSHSKDTKELDHKSVIVIEEHARTRERTDIISERVQIIENDPKGAVVSLTLGLIATIIAVFLISCGFSVVRRRRGRCGHGPYAHDADYLVNGMYL